MTDTLTPIEPETKFPRPLANLRKYVVATLYLETDDPVDLRLLVESTVPPFTDDDVYAARISGPDLREAKAAFAGTPVEQYVPAHRVRRDPVTGENETTIEVGASDGDPPASARAMRRSTTGFCSSSPRRGRTCGACRVRWCSTAWTPWPPTTSRRCVTCGCSVSATAKAIASSRWRNWSTSTATRRARSIATITPPWRTCCAPSWPGTRRTRRRGGRRRKDWHIWQRLAPQTAVPSGSLTVTRATHPRTRFLSGLSPFPSPFS